MFGFDTVNVRLWMRIDLRARNQESGIKSQELGSKSQEGHIELRTGNINYTSGMSHDRDAGTNQLSLYFGQLYAEYRSRNFIARSRNFTIMFSDDLLYYAQTQTNGCFTTDTIAAGL